MAHVPKSLIAFTENHTTVYHVLRFGGRIKQQFIFTLDTDSVFAEPLNKSLDKQFDSRKLPEKYKKGKWPKSWVRNAIKDGFNLSTIEEGVTERSPL